LDRARQLRPEACGAQSAALSNPAIGQWKLAALGDFNGDGTRDLLPLQQDGLLRIDVLNSAGEGVN